MQTHKNTETLYNCPQSPVYSACFILREVGCL